LDAAPESRGLCLEQPAGAFDLEQTLDSGQCFRWQRAGPREYRGIVQSTALIARQDADQLRVCYAGGHAPLNVAAFVREYFDLSRDYQTLLRRWRRDRRFAQVAPPRAGIHILRQGPFETLISFIISANNNIARIRSIIRRLCTRYGSPLETVWGREYSFPTPEVLAGASLGDLRRHCGLGYRDAYVRRAAQAVAAHPDFAGLAALPTPELRQQLKQFEGVGEKVADCVLLFGFHRLEAFPVDTWIRRTMADLYFDGRAPRLREVQAFAAQAFGAHAGVAQQYLFAGVRSKTGTRNQGPGTRQGLKPGLLR
jgi:N-glycosylase/DNA lyase